MQGWHYSGAQSWISLALRPTSKPELLGNSRCWKACTPLKRASSFEFCLNYGVDGFGETTQNRNWFRKGWFILCDTFNIQWHVFYLYEVSLLWIKSSLMTWLFLIFAVVARLFRMNGHIPSPLTSSYIHTHTYTYILWTNARLQLHRMDYLSDQRGNCFAIWSSRGSSPRRQHPCRILHFCPLPKVLTSNHPGDFPVMWLMRELTAPLILFLFHFSSDKGLFSVALKGCDILCLSVRQRFHFLALGDIASMLDI